MQVARRLYVYLVSGVSLGFVLFGLQQLLLVIFDALGLGGGDLLGGGFASERLSVALALVAVGSPVWLVHWWFAERSVRAGQPSAEAERQSAVRAAYFAGLLGVLLLVGAFGATTLIQVGIGSVLAPAEVFGPSIAESATILLVVGGAWAYHALIRRRDMAAGELHGPAVSIPRAYLYGAAFGGAATLLGAQLTLVDAAIRTMFGQAADPYLWVPAVGSATIGAAVWAGHAAYISRLRRGSDWRATSERAARLRLAFLVALIVVGVGGAIGLAATAVQAVVVGVMAGAASGMAAGFLAPALSAIPYGLAAWGHARALRREATADIDPDRPALGWRLEQTALALTCLAFAAVGVAQLIAVTINTFAEESTEVLAGGSFAAQQLGIALPYAVIGGGLWIGAWARVERRRAANPLAEARSTVRRGGLLLVLGASVIAGLPSLAVILYRLFGSVLGAGLSGDAVAELATPVGFLVVAIVFGAYHGLALRRDQALIVAADEGAPAPSSGVPEPAGPEAGAWEGEGGPIGAPGIALILHGPNGADLDEALAKARAALPEGYRLERD